MPVGLGTALPCQGGSDQVSSAFRELSVLVIFMQINMQQNNDFRC